ncbi:MAG: methionine--tRNA ligase [Mycoplasmatales bacterium]
MKNYYITTPIYYPSAKLHLGHCYTTIAGDFISRYKKMQGYNVFYLTGTDEHGEKLERKAQDAEKKPKEFIDPIVDDIKNLWKSLDIDYTNFIRTTDVSHETTVKKIFSQLLQSGDIYLGEYTGLYCVSCETFFTETQSQDGCCPDCGAKLDEIKEESYFLRCSKYEKRLINYIEENKNFIQPTSRKNELMSNFLKPGLKDLAISRTSFDWGIKVPDDDKHVIYVWLDALSNYISALGYKNENINMMEQYWPADLHLLGKEIVRFHAVYWPILLMALDLPLPKRMFAHGWILMSGDKMSKSKGNVIYPEFLVENMGPDTVRYYLMSEMPFGDDGRFTADSFVNKINSDIANSLGNLVNRTVSMSNQYLDGTVNKPIIAQQFIETSKLIESLDSLPLKLDGHIDNMELPKYIKEIQAIISQTNKYIDETKPWILGKKENREEIGEVLYTILRSLEVINAYISPVLPNISKAIAKNIGIGKVELFSELVSRETFNVHENPSLIIERMDVEKTIKMINKEIEANTKLAKENL